MIRNADTKDIPQITGLFCELLEQHKIIDPEYYQYEADYTAKLLTWAEQTISGESQFLLVSVNNTDDKISGFIAGYVKYLFPWYKIKSVGHISFLVVDEKCQKMGIGRSLENAAFTWFKERNLNYIEVYTNEKNNAGVNAWDSYGYLPFNKFLRKRISF